MSFILFISSDDYDDTLNFLETSTVAVDSNVLLAINGTIYNLYRIRRDWNLVTNVIGTYGENMELQIQNLNRRFDLNGTTINSSLVVSHYC